MTRRELVLRYTAFAIFAALANLLTQQLVLSVSSAGFGYVAALVAGTGIGLVTKYLLDKRWIFFDPLQDFRHETSKFSVYTLTGVATTLLFWASETAFWAIGQTDEMRILGAMLGLAAGYAIKYRLDRRFVFGNAT